MPETLIRQETADAAVLRAVDRAVAELRHGGTVVLLGAKSEGGLLQAAEGVRGESLARMARLAGQAPILLLTRQRANSLGLLGSAGGTEQDAVAIRCESLDAETIAELADPTWRPNAALPAATVPACGFVEAPARLGPAGVHLAKMARLLPAVVLARFQALPDVAALAAAEDLLVVTTSEIADYRFAAARSLEIVAEARVPLAGAEDSRIVAFRPSDGGVEHLAILIGRPDPKAPVLTRLHSECFTGDLLGSLRCDCGDQLRGAITAISAAGAGVLLYLAQEGRGIGLVNKLRAYALQDRGADTFEANEQLGFDADERIYLPAAEMLRKLGFRQVRLMTNNPDKVAGLGRCGIDVAERVRHSFPSNGHNEFYLATKTQRGGHLV